MVVMTGHESQGANDEDVLFMMFFDGIESCNCHLMKMIVTWFIIPFFDAIESWL